MSIAHFFYGLIFVALGTVGLKYNFQLVGITGNVGFAERYLGSGGTYAFYKLLSIALCVGGLLYMFGLFDPIARTLLSPLSQYFRPLQGS